MAAETTLSSIHPLPKKSFYERITGTKRRRDTIEGYLFILPVVLGLLIFTIGPVLASFYISFTKYPILRSPEWLGVRNYVNMVSREPYFWQAVKVTVIYALTAVPLGITGGFMLALLLNQRIKGMPFFRASFYMPTIVPAVANAVLWGWLLNPDYGLINAALKTLGLPTSRFLGDPSSALGSLVLMSLWAVGGGMIIYLAGLQGIPETFYEAAKIDGASNRQLFRFITLPLMTPTLFFGLVMGLIGAFQYFTEAFILTSGGPLFATYFYSLMVYERAFRFTQMGMAAAMAWFLLVIVLVLTLLVFRSSALWVFYETEVK